MCSMQASCGDVPTSTAAAAAAVSTATDLSAPTSQVSQSNSSTTLMAVLLVLIQAPAGTAASQFCRLQSASATEEQIKTRQSRRQQDFPPPVCTRLHDKVTGWLTACCISHGLAAWLHHQAGLLTGSFTVTRTPPHIAHCAQI